MPEASDDYEIRAKIVVHDASGPGASSAERRMDRVVKHAERASGSITGWLTKAFALITSGSIVGGIIRINDQLDSAINGIATLLSAQTGMGITDSLAAARDIIKGLRQDAAAGVGELSHYRDAFQQILGPAMAGGAGVDKIRELTRNTLTAGFAMRGQEGLSLAPLDIVQALTSGVSDRVTPFASGALRSINVQGEEFNKKKIPERIELLNKAFAKFAPGAAVMGLGWDAQWSTLIDRATSFVGILNQPLFNRWLEGLRSVNARLQEHQGQLEVIVTRWGQRLLGIWDQLISSAGTYAAIVAGVSVYQGLGGAAGLASAGAGLGRAGAVGRAGLGAVGAAARDPFGFGNLFGGALAGAGLGGGGGSSGIGGLFASLRGFLPVLSRLAGPLAIVTTLFLAVRGAISEYPGVFLALAQAFAVLGQTLVNVGETFGFLTKGGSLLNMVGAALGGVLIGLVRGVDLVLRVLGSLVVGLSVVGRVIGQLLKAIYMGVSGDVGGARGALGEIPTILQESNRELEKLWKDAFTFRTGGEDGGGVPDVPGKGNIPTTGQTVNIGKVEIRQNLETNADPARIANAFETVLDNVNRHKRQGVRHAMVSPLSNT